MLILLLSVLTVFANENYTADVYDAEGKEKIFTYEGYRKYTKDTMEYSGTYKDLQGQVVATEGGTAVTGVMTKYTADRPSGKDSGVIEVVDGKLVFNYTDSGKAATPKKENFKPETLFAGNLVPFMQTRLDKLAAKEELKFPYVVWYRKETINFKLYFRSDDGTHLMIKMHPTNFIYASMVKPLEFTFDKKTKKLVSLKGRALPKVKNKDIEALIKYN